MRRVFYAGTEFPTTDELAVELIGYAAELTERGDIDTLELPTVTTSGGDGHVTLIIGPSAPMVSQPDPEGRELDMSAAVAQIREARAHLAEQKAFLMGSPRYDWFLDFEI